MVFIRIQDLKITAILPSASNKTLQNRHWQKKSWNRAEYGRKLNIVHLDYLLGKFGLDQAEQYYTLKVQNAGYLYWLNLWNQPSLQ